MKQIFIALLCLIIPINVVGSNQDSTKIAQFQNRIVQVQSQIDSLEKMSQRNMLEMSSFTTNIKALQDSLLLLNVRMKEFYGCSMQSIKDLKVINQENVSCIRSLNNHMVVLQDSLVMVNMEMQKGYKSLEQYIDNTEQKTDMRLETLFLNIQNRTKYIVIIIMVFIFVLTAFWFLCKRDIQKNVISIGEIEKMQKQIQEESVKLDDRFVSLLDKQLSIQYSNSNAQEVDHSLALKVADEIVRIEMNLSRMDSSIKGYKQLARAVERIKNNFLANGYEIIDMLGKPYNEGMKVVANFVSDENLKQGEQIITGIIKPQINYNGQMIQAAQITVSQNI